MENISFLLGAGFSRPAGDPIASDLNNKILKIRESDFYIHSSGTVIVGENPEFDPNRLVKMFFVELTSFYTKNVANFNYEEFYDYIELNNEKANKNIVGFYNKFCSDTNIQHYSLSSLLQETKRILNQLVLYFLHDRNGNKYYSHKVTFGGTFCSGFHEYDNFLSLLKHLGENYTIHIHTLNHDLFFDQFQNCDWLYKLSDGFEEAGSKYFGRTENEHNYLMVRLQRYTGKYEGNFRFYKLHGSSNYFPYYTNRGGIEYVYDNYLKVVPGVRVTELYKEIQDAEGNFEYENCWINYHSDFLTGTTSKILRYNETFYTQLVEKFRENIACSNVLIVIGYGFADKEINSIINQKIQKGCKVIIIDPYPSQNAKDFGKSITGKVLEYGIESINPEEIMKMLDAETSSA